MSHKPAHLLLVDDDPGLLKLLGLRLTSEGYSVVTRLPMLTISRLKMFL